MLIGLIYIATAIYYARTINSIKKLSDTGATLATGDRRPRIDLGTRDELKLVGDSFNDMAMPSAGFAQRQAGADQVLSASHRFSESLVADHGKRAHRARRHPAWRRRSKR